MNLSLLQCLFANAMATYAIKLAAGVSCNLNLEYIYKTYNYMLLVNANLNEGCDIPARLYSDIISHQNTLLLNIQPCC